MADYRGKIEAVAFSKGRERAIFTRNFEGKMEFEAWQSVFYNLFYFHGYTIIATLKSKA